MPLEIEVKFRIADPADVRRRIIDAGAEPAGTVLEHNTYFDLPGGKLRCADCGLRIRVNEGPDGRTRTVLTHKGPRRPGELKIRSEAEVGVDSAEAAAAVLAALGYEPVLSFQKRRATFQLGGAEIVLDELPELGSYLEIEAADEQTVQRARARLGLADAEPVTRTYSALVADHLAGRGDQTALRF